jgi:hypothetical protein
VRHQPVAAHSHSSSSSASPLAPGAGLVRNRASRATRRPLHLEDAQGAAADGDLVADPRDAAEPAQHEAAHRRVVLVRQLQLVPLVQLGDAKPPLMSTSPSGPAVQLRRLLVQLVLDLADDLLDDVLDGDDALGAAELVDDDGQVRALPAHLAQQRLERLRVRHEQRRPHDRPQVVTPCTCARQTSRASTTPTMRSMDSSYSG